ncbi:MAG: glutathione S-transferase family protein [Alphaproteobacteria bacterium]|nr:glutathione S-transferase [Rhodobiaceae bacterium]MBO6542933.1 glutathione S-transferase family protein [Alphaproteobacteria bacterium]MBO6627140.1 glutathione S-transferase family protein [Alphaproteobacteria bacterium]MDF1626369.1 glutathione S-transferase family protein [Parvibaculaceae bacterium]
MSDLVLVSHTLCPYVQRAMIVLAEKQADHQRIYIDLKDKPAWFREISPLGKVPVLIVDKEPVFESAVICEFLEETIPPQLHPAQPLEKARHRAWIEFASATLSRISSVYNAPREAEFERELADLKVKFSRLNDALSDGPYFDGQPFHMVDAAFAPVFRYIDTFEKFLPKSPTAGLMRLNTYRTALAARPSVQKAVSGEYPSLLWKFLEERGSHISTLMASRTV